MTWRATKNALAGLLTGLAGGLLLGALALIWGAAVVSLAEWPGGWAHAVMYLLVVVLVPVLVPWVVQGLTALQRSRLRATLGTEIPAPVRTNERAPWPAGPWFAAGTWRQLGFHLLAVVTGVGGGLLVIACWLVAFPLAPLVARRVARADERLARAMLGPGRREELALRIESLARSRADAVAAADAERRRIERDLHDGAQQRLVSLAMNLGMARERFAGEPEPVRRAIAEAHDEAVLALSEVREFPTSSPSPTCPRPAPTTAASWPSSDTSAPRAPAATMGRPRQLPAKESVISAVSLCVAAALSGCSASSSAGSHPAATVASAGAAVAFTVAGVRTVRPSGSQDTHRQTPKGGCDSATFEADEALGAKVAHGFALAGFPASADLLAHFLNGKGTEVAYRAGSLISQKALATGAFQAVNHEVQEAVLSQLKAGRTRVRLSAAQLPTVAFESQTSDLYWGFRGTQGLTVTGKGSRENGRYVGTLSYLIRDSYGFPASDTLGGFGPPMRYLQTACGAPQHAGGAHWFPDAITVTVPFNRPA